MSRYSAQDTIFNYWSNAEMKILLNISNIFDMQKE